MARRRRTRRKKNPTPLQTALIAGGVAVVGGTIGYIAYREVQKRKQVPGQPPRQTLPPSEALADVLVAGGTLASAPFVVQDVQQPIALSAQEQSDQYDRVPVLRVKIDPTIIAEPTHASFDGNVVTTTAPDGSQATFDVGAKAISALVTDVTGEFARMAYELAFNEIANKGIDWSDPTTMDAAIQSILQRIAPKVDWSKKLQAFTAESDPWRAWVAVQLLGTLANQSYYNKVALQG